VVDKGEMHSLTALGIASISLSSDGIGYSAAGGDVSVVGTGSYTRTDGSTGVLADAVFNTGAAVQQEQARTASASSANPALIGAIAAAGLVAAEPLAAATVHDSGQVSLNAVEGGSHYAPSLTPVAAEAVAKLHAAEQASLASADRPSVHDDSSPLHQADVADAAQLDADASQHLQAPAVLLQSSETPAHNQVTDVSPVAAAAVAMPSAAQLAGNGTGPGEAAQHNAVVGNVLADALHGGESNGIDALLASLPAQHGGGMSAIEAFAGHAEGLLATMNFGSGQAMDSLHMLALHVDAPIQT
jgi:hypothetical protein